MFTYKYIVAGNKVIALSTYAGKTVRGVAKCAPNDEFDVERGKDLATARCAYKIALKRQKRARMKCDEAFDVLAEANAFYMQMRDYEQRADAEAIECKEALNYFKDNM